MNLVFPYKQLGQKYFPIIPLVLSRGRQVKIAEALVDSGTNISVFNSALAEELGIKIESGEKIVLSSANSHMIGYLHKVKTRLGKAQLNLPIIFTKELTSSFNLLGREGFFNKFIVCFNDGKSKIKLTALN
ncbi:hypothetical protein COU24_02895 [Candidatus Kuenenbacteria bacterium CG10_big_fil_rev_8_21_14_0_10_39_14]|uniref:Peptidase A2 domain-containing protein n=1 Tax=Candidatus Kuenenbacteria bacterium CG10_big_fil_rev_8_21_14_0_10_39_14 TaxID=1974619 RepID=A0A2H0U577_9BACT|nr:MAG: hypothetical protein COU24_02895 [Candidatus Kuenenbacteria bacterium CG10_big_fil_rev_8_21_14_0_10_39_14]